MIRPVSSGSDLGCAPTGGQIPGWDRTAPYDVATTAVERLCVLSYPSTNTALWTRLSCGCDEGVSH